MAEEKKPFHERVAEKIIDQLKAGTAPWQRPWNPAAPGTEGGSVLPMNPTTGKRYRGVNVVNLMSEGHTDNRWMTYKQAGAAGAQVRKGEKGTLVQYWKFDDEQTLKDAQGKPLKDAEGNTMKVRVELERPRPFYAVVFNAEQIDGLPPRTPPQPPEWNPIDRADALLRASGAKITETPGNRAFYSPATDSITLPERSQFPSADRFYGTALHEVGHWTGHPNRLDRDLAHPFGSEGYAKEELRAEIASMILGDELQIGHDPSQHVAYVASWIAALENDPMEIVRACSDAEKINTYMLAFEQKQIQERDGQTIEQPAPIAAPADAEEAERRAAMDTPIAAVLQSTATDFSHFHGYNHSYDPTIGAPHATLEAALASAGFERIGDVVGDQSRDYPAMWETAIERLSPVFGIAPDDTGEGVNFNAYLERKGLADAFASTAEQLTQSPTYTVEAWNEQDNAFAAIGGRLEPDKALDLFLETARENREHAGRPGAVEGADYVGEPRIVADRSGSVVAGLGSLPSALSVIPEDVMMWAAAEIVERGRAIRGAADPQNLPQQARWQSLVENHDLLNGKAAEPAQAAGIVADQPTAINVPFREKNEAKQLGARWDKDEKTWYVPAGIDQTPFAKWAKDAPAPAVEGQNQQQAPAQANADVAAPAAPSAEQEGQQMTDRSDTPKLPVERKYLAVPYGERHVAKAAGARWDAPAKSWYAPEGSDPTKLARWNPENRPNRQEKPITPQQEFAEAMKDMGLTVPAGHPIMDGQRHRVPADGDKGKETTGSYRAYLDGHPAGHIENFRTNLDMKWKYTGAALSEEEKARLSADAATKRDAREREQTATYAESARRVQMRAAGYKQITEPTPYMAAKGIKPTIGAMTDGKDGSIHLPAIDAQGQHWTTQYIQEDGTKRFAKDSHKEGCFHVVNGTLADLEKAPRLMIGEGYSTMTTIAGVVGHPTVAGFDAGNLPAVAKALHERFPDKPVFIMADDDLRVQQTHGHNPGRDKANDAADAVGGKAVHPIFAPGEQAADPKRFTDFNDLEQNSSLGRAGVERQVKAALQTAQQALPTPKLHVDEEIHHQRRSGPAIGNDQPAQRRNVRL
jgi:putative DNA primase/helicase